MLLESLLTQPVESPKLLLREATYGDAGRALLLQEVMGLANAQAGAGARHILFGVSRDDADKPKFSKLNSRALQEVEGYADLVRQYIEPDIKVAAVVGQISGNIVAALELTHCTNPPYVIKMDVSTALRRGDCWVHEGGLFRPAQRADLDRMYRFTASSPVRESDEKKVKVGFAGDPNSKQLRIKLPDVLNPPSKLAASRMQHEIDAKKDAAERDQADTRIQRLVHARLYGNERNFEAQGMDTLVEGFNAVMGKHESQDNYYYFETNAVRFNLALVNTGHEALENLSLMLTLPYAPEFRVADRLHPPPGKQRTPQESELLGYPRVKIYDKAVQVKYKIDFLEPDKVISVFEKELRIAVLPALAGKKVHAKYSLQAEGLKQPETGRLTLIFRP